MTERILVTDGETRAALATVRALGAGGAEVHVTTSRPRSLAAGSRHASFEHLLPDCETRPRAWVDALFTLCRERAIGLVVPISEISLGSLYAFGGAPPCAIACPDAGAYHAAVDKAALAERARKLGIDVPAGVVYSAPREVEKLPETLEFPVVVKSRRSRWLSDQRWYSGGVQIARDDAELRTALADPGFADGLLLQEFVDGYGEAVFLLAEHGRTRVRFSHRRIREMPPTGGQSVVRESIVPDRALLDASERLLESLGWHGVAMVEFRRSASGRAALMEINPRLWGSLQLAIDAGVDFASLLVALHGGGALANPQPRPGVRSRWLLGDLDHLATSLRRPALRRQLDRSVVGLLWDFARSFADGSRSEIWRREDPRPFWRELRARLAPRERR